MAECTIQLSIDEFLKSYKTLLCKYNKYLEAEEVSLDDTNKIKDQIRELLEYYKDILVLEAYRDIEELDTLIASINQKLANGEFVGVQGEPFLYEDFTPQQLEALKVKGDKGDSFKYEDFTSEQLQLLKQLANVYSVGGNIGVNTSSPSASFHTVGSYRLDKLHCETISVGGLVNHTIEIDVGSYSNNIVEITASQTNGGFDNNLYIRGRFSNNHLSHHWDEFENVGFMSGSTVEVSVSASDSDTEGRLTIEHIYNGMSFSNLTVKVYSHYLGSIPSFKVY